MPEPLIEETPETLILERLREWKEKRPKAIGENEAVRCVGAISRFVWRGHGVKKLIWRASSSACNFCKMLHNKVVGIQEPFLADGEVLTDKYIDKDGKPRYQKLKSYGAKFSAPIHRSCKCKVLPQI